MHIRFLSCSELAALSFAAYTVTAAPTKRNALSAAFEDTVVSLEVPNELKERCKSRLMQHAVGITTHWMHFPRYKNVSFVQSK